MSSHDLSTLLRYRVDQTPASTVAFVLTVIEGPETGKSLRIDAAAPTRAYVGSSPASDLVIADREVSRRHLALEVAGSRLRASDLGSKNGTFVDGIAMVEVYLSGDETVRLGSSAIRVERVETGTQPELPYVGSCGSLIGMSREMRRLYPLIERLAASDVPVLIEGETGTGKEVAARTIHELSRRREGPFVVFDCTASLGSLIEGDLFGHEEGSFAGGAAQRAAKGVFEQADGGTLLIDEIGDLELGLQPKLVRALERSEFRRLGSERVHKFDVRIVTATRRNLDLEVQEGRFRDDLFHRLVVGRFELPPLRTRRGDIAILARRFVEEMQGDPAAVTAGFLARWEASQWPGNVRELRNAVARCLALGELDLHASETEDDDAFPAYDAAGNALVADPFDDVIAEGLPLIESRQKMIEAFERRYLTAALASTGGNVTHAARAAGIPRRYFQALRAKRFKPG